MNVASLLADLRSRDIQVWPEGETLRFNAPSGALTPDLREKLRVQKTAIVDFLRNADAVAKQPRAIVPLQARGNGIPVYAVPGHNGDVFSFRALVQHLGGERPFHGLQPPGLDGASEPLRTVEDLAAYFARQIRAFQPAGACVIAGYCAGGVIAYELAQQLRSEGPSVRQLVLFAGAHPYWYARLPQTWQRVALAARRMRRHLAYAFTHPLSDVRGYLAERLVRMREAQAAEPDPLLALRDELKTITAAAVLSYRPARYEGSLALVYPSRKSLLSGSAMTRWRAHSPNIAEFYGPDGCEGDVMLLEPHAGPVAEIFRSIADRP